MGKIASFLMGPLKNVFDGAIGIINSIKGGSPEEKNAATLALAQLHTAFQEKLVEADERFAEMQRDVIVAEANGHSWLQRNWRPIVMIWLVIILSTIVWTGGYLNGRELDRDFVMEILSIIKYGLSGYVVGRSAEKIAPSVAQIFKK